MPAYKEMRGQSQIQLDGLTRENAGVGLDELVQIHPISCPTAERVVLVPTNVVPSERDMDYIGSRLDGLPVSAENRIRAVLFGARWADFKVESTVSKGSAFRRVAELDARIKDIDAEQASLLQALADRKGKTVEDGTGRS